MSKTETSAVDVEAWDEGASAVLASELPAVIVTRGIGGVGEFDAFVSPTMPLEHEMSGSTLMAGAGAETD